MKERNEKIRQTKNQLEWNQRRAHNTCVYTNLSIVIKMSECLRARACVRVHFSFLSRSFRLFFAMKIVSLLLLLLHTLMQTIVQCFVQSLISIKVKVMHIPLNGHSSTWLCLSIT